jgi:hypothetical protein
LASRPAKSGTSVGCFFDGRQVTHRGPGFGFHLAVTISATASTSSSRKRPECLSSATNCPQPTSPHRDRTRPVSALRFWGSGRGPNATPPGLRTPELRRAGHQATRVAFCAERPPPPLAPGSSSTASSITPTASNSPAKAYAEGEESSRTRLDPTPGQMTQIHRPARLATRAASSHYGGRHHPGILGGIAGIRTFIHDRANFCSDDDDLPP